MYDFCMCVCKMQKLAFLETNYNSTFFFCSNDNQFVFDHGLMLKVQAFTKNANAFPSIPREQGNALNSLHNFSYSLLSGITIQNRPRK